MRTHTHLQHEGNAPAVVSAQTNCEPSWLQQMLAFCIITRMLGDIISFLPGDGSTLKCTSLMCIKQFSKLSWGFWPGRCFWSCYECLRSAACRRQFLIFPPPFALCCSTLNLSSAYLFHRTWPASVTRALIPTVSKIFRGGLNPSPAPWSLLQNRGHGREGHLYEDWGCSLWTSCWSVSLGISV